MEGQSLLTFTTYWESRHLNPGGPLLCRWRCAEQRRWNIYAPLALWVLGQILEVPARWTQTDFRSMYTYIYIPILLHSTSVHVLYPPHMEIQYASKKRFQNRSIQYCSISLKNARYGTAMLRNDVSFRSVWYRFVSFHFVSFLFILFGDVQGGEIL